MDPPPLPPHQTTIPNHIPTTTQLNHPSSPTSSPHSHSNNPETYDDHPPPPPILLPTTSKLRLMCSYGGHIIPRPHDKSLCYVGGDTRLVAIDRHSSLSYFSSRLSRTLLNGRNVTLKYQLPNEDLDSLVSLTSDEDLDNMFEEYDRTTTITSWSSSSASPLKPSRLRLFLFPVKPETAASMGSLLDDAKSETWFVDALNSAGLLPIGFSDSAAAIDGLLEFDGSSSLPSMESLAPVIVRVEEGGGGGGSATVHDQMVCLDDQFSQINVVMNTQKEDHGFVNVGGAAAAATVASDGILVNPKVISRGLSDDERLDQVATSAFRKPPLPLRPVQLKTGGDAYGLTSPDSKHGGGYNLQSPDSVASDSSIASATSLSKHTFYQDPTPIATRENKAPAEIITPIQKISDLNSQIQMHQVHDSVYLLSSQQNQQQQQQFVHPSTHYIHHPTTGPAPISSYYPIYAPHSYHPLHRPIDQQYQMYFLPVTQTQPYNLTVQSNITESNAVFSSRPLTPPNPTSSTPASNEIVPPICPPKIATPNISANPAMVRVPSQQFHQHYIGLGQMPHPSQSMAPISAATANYGSECAHPSHDHVHYAQRAAAPLTHLYQTMTPAAAVLLSQDSTQVPAANTKHQIRSSQPL